MSGTITSYEDLDAWKLGVRACKRVYEATASFPPDERFGLVSQLRRAVVSIPSNIAEGWGRGSTVEYARFLRIARGSLYEVETQLVVAKGLGYLADEACREVVAAVRECGRVLAGLIRSIENKLGSQQLASP